MNILLVAEDFILNGVTRHMVDLANGLSENGHTVYVAATTSTQKDKLSTAVVFVPIFLSYPERYKKRYSGIYKSFKILVRTIREHKIDIIHTHKRYADALGSVAARTTGIKHVSTCHNKFTTYRRFSPFGDITIAPSPEIEQMLLQVFRMNRERIKVVSHGIQPLHRVTAEVIAQQRQMLGIESDRKVILSVGHLNRQKDRTTLIEAIHILQLNDQFKNAVCLIVGEGEEYAHMQAMIHQYQLESLIKILPAKSDIDVLNTMADICVITSLYEAGPYVLLEAASLAKPTIGTSVGFIPSFIGNNEAGICVTPGQPHQLADAIYSLLSDPKKTSSLGEKAYRQFMNNYTYDRFIKNTIAVYEEVLRTN